MIQVLGGDTHEQRTRRSALNVTKRSQLIFSKRPKINFENYSKVTGNDQIRI